jgi:hypothetical protein
VDTFSPTSLAAHENKSQADRIIEKFGGITALARALGHKHPTTVQGWKDRKFIPAKHQADVLNKARDLGLDLTTDDFFDVRSAPTEAA